MLKRLKVKEKLLKLFYKMVESPEEVWDMQGKYW